MFYRISAREANLFLSHLLGLSEDDRYTRFTSKMSDLALLKYVNGINFNEDEVVAYFEANNEVVAAAHVGIRKQHAEIGISVSDSYRKRGIGRLLFKRCLVIARARHCKTISVMCLRSNLKMIRLAKASGLTLAAEGTEMFGECETHKPDIFDIMMMANQYASEMAVTMERVFLPFVVFWMRSVTR